MKRYIFLMCLVFGLVVISCQKNSKSETDTTIGDYKAPETIPLKFTESEPFEWETVTNDSLTTPVTYSLNVDALPSKPFELNQFKPLETPMKEYDLDWDNFPTAPVKFDSVAFTVTTAPIKRPKITKMKQPGIMDGTNANLLQLSVNEGFVNNDITSFLETKDGAIWIGTAQSSLMRYDGENTFTYDYPNVYAMTFDQQGRLWLMRPGARVVTVLDFKKDIAYTILPNNGQIQGLDVVCDYTGTLYIACFQNELYRIDPELQNLQKINNEGNIRSWKLLQDRNDNLWFAADKKIVVIDKERKELKTINRIANYEFNNSVWDIKEVQSGDIWLSVPFNDDSESPIALGVSLKNNKISILNKETGYNVIGRSIEEDNEGNLWIFGDVEAFVLSKNKNTYKTIDLNSKLQGRDRLTRPLKRKDGSLWIATTDKGVVIANEHTLNTTYFDTSTGLIGDQVWDIEEDSSGELWLGTNNGINIIDPQKNTIKSITKEQLHFLGNGNSTINYLKQISKDTYFWKNGAGFSIYDRQRNKMTQYASNANVVLEVLGFAKSDDHTFWIYTPEGLYVYDIEFNSLKKLTSKTDPDILKTQFGAELVYDGNELLWIPTFNRGLAEVNLKNNTIRYLNKKQGLSHNNTGVASFSKEDELWVTTLNGIAILNLEQNTLTNLREENGLVPSEMYDLIERGDIMYGASVNGLIPIDKLTAKNTNKGFYTFNGGLGFKSNDYLSGSSKFLKNGQFWAGVVNSSDEFRLLIMNAAPKPDSTLSTVYISKMYVRDEDPGFKYKVRTDSLNNKILSYANATNMKWDSIKHPYNIPTNLVLPFDQNSLSFSYASSDVFNRDQLTYRFILEGEDEDWTYADTKTKTKNYYNLKPGEYTFKVASRSFTKQWSTPDMFNFSISPPWWQTWWAYLLFGLIAAGILRIYIAFRAKKLKKENKFLEEKVKERTNELEASIEDLKATQLQLIQSEKMASLGELTAGIAHEIQNPLNFVNNFSEVSIELFDEMNYEMDKEDLAEAKFIAKNIKQNLEKINHHGKRADNIVKGMLQHSRNSSGTKEPTDINALADEYLRLAYHGLRAKDKSFNATLVTNFDDSIGRIDLIPQDIGRVILNLITNAFYTVDEKKKSGIANYEPKVSVSTKQLKNQIVITVKDNGNGIPKHVLDKIYQPFFTTKPTGQGTGLGLSMSYDIVKAHSGELKVETKDGEGSKFSIIFTNTTTLSK
ncbi:sensor histidine kinase [Aureibaculum algae]|nr:sensor histidine kinase [Aureibaculum algae]